MALVLEVVSDSSKALASLDKLNAKVGNIDGTIGKTRKSIDGLFAGLKALGTIAIASSVAKSVLNIGDAAINLDNKLKVVTKSQADFNLVFKGLRRIAVESQTPVKDLVGFYSKVAVASEAFNRSQKETLQVTSTVGKALTLFGAAASERESVLLQLGQGLGANKLGGEELNALLEGSAGLTSLIARNLDGKFTMADMKGLAAAGELSFEPVFEAILKGTAEIDGLFDDAAVTFGGAMTNLGSVMGFAFVDITDGLFGKGSSIANVINDLARSIFSSTQNLRENAENFGANVAKSFESIGSRINSAFKEGLNVVGFELPSIDFSSFTEKLELGFAGVYSDVKRFGTNFGERLKAGFKIISSKDVFATVVEAYSGANSLLSDMHATAADKILNTLTMALLGVASMTTGFQRAFGMLGDSISGSLSAVASDIMSGFSDFGSEISTQFDFVFSEFSFANSLDENLKIGESLVSGSFNAFKTLLARVIDSFGLFEGQLGTSLRNFVNNLSVGYREAFSGLGAEFQAAAGQLVTEIFGTDNKFVNGLRDFSTTLGDKVKGIFNEFSDTLASDGLGSAIEAVVGNISDDALVNELDLTFNELSSTISSGYNTIVDTIAPLKEMKFSFNADDLENNKRIFMGVFTDLKLKLPLIFGAISEVISGAAGRWSVIVSDMFDGLTFDSVSADFKQLMVRMLATARSGLVFLHGGLVGVAGSIDAAFESIGVNTNLGGLLTKISSFVNRALSFITKAFEDSAPTFEGISGAFKEIIKKAFTELLDFIKSIFGRIERIAIDGEFEGLSAALNTVKNWAITVEGWFFWLYDKVIGHSWVPDLVLGVIAWFGRLAVASRLASIFGISVGGVFKTIASVGLLGLAVANIDTLKNGVLSLLPALNSAMEGLRSLFKMKVSPVEAAERNKLVDSEDRASNFLSNGIDSLTDTLEQFIPDFGKMVDKFKENVFAAVQSVGRDTLQLVGAAFSLLVILPIALFGSAMSKAVVFAITAAMALINRNFFMKDDGSSLATSVVADTFRAIDSLLQKLSGNKTLIEAPQAFMEMAVIGLLFFKTGRAMLGKSISNFSQAPGNFLRATTSAAQMAVMNRRLGDVQARRNAGLETAKFDASLARLKASLDRNTTAVVTRATQLGVAGVDKTQVRGILAGGSRAGLGALVRDVAAMNALGSARADTKAIQQLSRQQILTTTRVQQTESSLKEDIKNIFKEGRTARSSFIGNIKGGVGVAAGTLGAFAGFQLGGQIAEGIAGSSDLERVGFAIAGGLVGQASLTIIAGAIAGLVLGIVTTIVGMITASITAAFLAFPAAFIATTIVGAFYAGMKLLEFIPDAWKLAFQDIFDGFFARNRPKIDKAESADVKATEREEKRDGLKLALEAATTPEAAEKLQKAFDKADASATKSRATAERLHDSLNLLEKLDTFNPLDKVYNALNSIPTNSNDYAAIFGRIPTSLNDLAKIQSNLVDRIKGLFTGGSKSANPSEVAVQAMSRLDALRKVDNDDTLKLEAAKAAADVLASFKQLDEDAKAQIGNVEIQLAAKRAGKSITTGLNIMDESIEALSKSIREAANGPMNDDIATQIDEWSMQLRREAAIREEFVTKTGRSSNELFAVTRALIAMLRTVKPGDSHLERAKGFSSGGRVVGPGTGTSDSIPAMLSHGEVVIKASVARKNANLLSALNAGVEVQGFADGNTSAPTFIQTGKDFADKIGTKMREAGEGARSLMEQQVRQSTLMNMNIKDGLATLRSEIAKVGLNASDDQLRSLGSSGISALLGSVRKIEGLDSVIKPIKGESLRKDSLTQQREGMLDELKETLGLKSKDKKSSTKAEPRIITFGDSLQLINEAFPKLNLELDSFNKLTDASRNKLIETSRKIVKESTAISELKLGPLSKFKALKVSDRIAKNESERRKQLDMVTSIVESASSDTDLIFAKAKEAQVSISKAAFFSASEVRKQAVAGLLDGYLKSLEILDSDDVSPELKRIYAEQASDFPRIFANVFKEGFELTATSISENFSGALNGADMGGFSINKGDLSGLDEAAMETIVALSDEYRRALVSAASGDASTRVRAKIEMDAIEAQVTGLMASSMPALLQRQREIGESFASSFRASADSALSGLLSGKMDGNKGMFETFVMGFVNDFSKSVTDTFSNAITSSLFGEGSAMGDFMKSLGKGTDSLGKLLVGDDKGDTKDATGSSALEGLGETFIKGFEGFGTSISGAFKGIASLFSGGGGGLFGGILSAGLDLFKGFSLFKADGGPINGPGTGTSDSIPAMLSTGEFVINAASASRFRPLLHSINSNRVSKFAVGGEVGNVPDSVFKDTPANSESQGQIFNINVTGDISRQTRAEISEMIPSIATGVNRYNKIRNIK